MKLVQEDGAPTGIQRGLVARRAEAHRPGVQPLGFAVAQLDLAIGLLGTRLTGIGTTVVLQIELADPGGQAGVIPDALVESLEEAIHSAELHLGEAR